MSATPRRRTVSGRLLVSYLVVIAAFAVTLGWGLRALSAAARDASLLRSAYVPLLSSIGEAYAEQNVMTTQLNHITAAKNPADVKLWIDTAHRLRPIRLKRIREDVTDGLPAELDRTGLREHVTNTTRQLEADLADQPARFERLVVALSTGDAASAERLRDELVARETDAAQVLRELRGRVDTELSDLTVDAKEREQRSLLLIIGLSVLTLIVGLVTSIYTRRVLAPLSAVTERARAVAEGDLAPRQVVATDDEIGELATTFEDMVAAIRRARAELVQAERLATIGKIAAHITHEVRNPLSSIGLNLELLEEELADVEREEATQLLAAVRSEVDRLSEISEQYLSAVREPKLHLTHESVEDLLREVHAFVRPELSRAGLASEIDVADLPEIEFDESQLRQALVNLIRNAREAAEPGGFIKLSASADDASVTITVEDDGPGVPEELRNTIFDPFYTTKRRGTGLGLALTRAILEAHGGTIVCEPREPRGTRFVIALPLAPQATGR